MLVSFINSLNAISMQHSASYNLMQSRQAMLSAMRNPNLQNMNFGALHQLDTKLALDIVNNKFQYEVATAMRKQADKQCKENRLNFFA